MLRIKDLDTSLKFYTDCLGLREVSRKSNNKGRFTLIFLATPRDIENYVAPPMIELTYNWEAEDYQTGRNFGHIAFEVDDIYAYCQHLVDCGVTINRPPRDGKMAFIKSPDNISIELLQAGEALPLKDPWFEMPNIGTW